ncbi:PAS domain-containing protein [Candidatus Magnetominusculus xianensis]|uniref:histidine kinase n=1 Tax=Candidatus Magnetominusculus xianensis TaxID=1748249 RepID=A0ABR5SB17_9BACT|nr:PAS domain-containing protein [Candidatus Magnetominusculus xianensis]KWT74904.1 multi-sensor signal transduction histidine kinase [Candidatus Magnetominusculus xianensis]MBF0405703.1 PAS domain-containing protein [Nitrospirota bacterium]
MKIKTKISVIVLMPFVALAAVIATILFYSSYEKKFERQRTAAIELVKNTFDTVIITNDILINGRKRGIHQLESINSSISQLFSELNLNGQSQRDMVKGIAADHKEITHLCIVYYNIFLEQKDAALQSTEYINRRNIVSDQLLLQAYSIVIRTLYLRDIVEQKEKELTNRMSTFIISMIGLLVITVGFVSIKLGRDIIDGLTKLQKGIETISAGNLNYIVPNEIPDEIGILAAHFNKMSVKLRETYMELKNEIDKRRMSEMDLRDSNTKLNMALEAAHMGDWELDLIDGSSTHRSLKHDQIFGYKKPLPHWNFSLFLEHVHPDDRTRVEKSYYEAAKNNQDWNFECRIIRADNEESWIWAGAKSIMDASGSPVQMIGLVQDITERKTLETKLDNIRLQLQSIIDSTSAVVFLKDIQGRYIFINSRYEMLFHLTKEGIVGKTDYDIFPKEFADSFRANDMEVEKKNESLHFEEIVMHDDVLHTYISVKFPMLDTKGNIYGVCGIATDITDRKRMEEELKILNKNLESMVVEETQKRRQNEQMLIQQSKMAAMGEMLGLIAHQWRQPLNAIALTVQDMKDAYAYGELNEEYIERTVDMTIVQTSFMSKTINDFRDFFKPSKEKSKFDVKTAIEELLSMFGTLFKKSDLEISLRADQGAGLITLGYPNEFKQVILNILNNASDAVVLKRQSDTSLQGLIEIAIGTEKDKVIVSIRDNGGGIPENLMERIFENYYTTKDKGSGIGLYMSKTIIETNMGGSLTARNVDAGAEFLITLAL